MTSRSKTPRKRSKRSKTPLSRVTDHKKWGSKYDVKAGKKYKAGKASGLCAWFSCKRRKGGKRTYKKRRRKRKTKRKKRKSHKKKRK